MQISSIAQTLFNLHNKNNENKLILKIQKKTIIINKKKRLQSLSVH